MKEPNDNTKERRRRWIANGRRIGTVLRKRGIQTRAQLLATRFDTFVSYRDIPGIGEVLGRQLRIMVNLYTRMEWEWITDLPWEGDSGA